MSGLIFFGSPPRACMASRMAARSTTAGTPVRSCRITRAGVNWISVSGSFLASQPARAVMWPAVMLTPSSLRSRFSSRTLRLNGRLALPGTASSRYISYDAPPASIVARLPKLFAVIVLRLPVVPVFVEPSASNLQYLDIKVLPQGGGAKAHRGGARASRGGGGAPGQDGAIPMRWA